MIFQTCDVDKLFYTFSKVSPFCFISSHQTVSASTPSMKFINHTLKFIRSLSLLSRQYLLQSTKQMTYYLYLYHISLKLFFDYSKSLIKIRRKSQLFLPFFSLKNIYFKMKKDQTAGMTFFCHLPHFYLFWHLLNNQLKPISRFFI